MQTLYWYDYETFGLDPQRDRPVQFSGLRTTLDLEVIAPPLTLFSRLSDDYIPHPEACLTTGITPKIANQKGLRECEFIDQINQAFSVPETCVVGYNNIRFDDEFTRHTLYRNLRDPYAREWRNGNTRWDLLNVVRMVRAIRPDGVNWPQNEEGQPSLRLEHLTKANGIDHMAAHDAESDVLATVALARCIKEAQPRLYRFLFEHRSKQALERLLAIGTQTPFLLASPRFDIRSQQLSLVMPLKRHARRPNSLWLLDLGAPLEELLDASLTKLQSPLHGLMSIQINQSPAVAPMSGLRAADADRLGIDLGYISSNCALIKRRWDEVMTLLQTLEDQPPKEHQGTKSADHRLYDGFVSSADRRHLDAFLALSPSDQRTYRATWDDGYLDELVFLYRARNYPETLGASEKEEWAKIRHIRLSDPLAGNGMTADLFRDRLDQIGHSVNLTSSAKATLEDLRCFSETLG